MPQINYETMLPPERTRRETERKSMPRKRWKWLLWVLSLILWALLLYGGYWLADRYIGGIYDRLAHIEQTNGANIEALGERLNELQSGLETHREQVGRLNEQLSAVERDLEAVKSEISLAGDTLNSSTETKQALSQRINDLSRELEELRKLIRQLEEAARVY